ncbi:hypothetical protein [Phascolarctobacterium sp.]|uniref:hypothetical protein n=1 Tax=Phascolarctobacterium sp. TaxID=2049039 RepID=UPI003865AB4B
MTKTDVVQKLQNYTYYKARLAEVKERLESMCYKTTTTYGNLAPSTGGGFTSKVETYGNKSYDLHRKEREYRAKLNEVVRFIQYSGLSNREKSVMWWIANNGKLQAYARRQRIGKDNVYKIRDRAINKIIAANTPHKVV